MTPTSRSPASRTSSSATRFRSARQTATITAVGTQSRSTTLFAARRRRRHERQGGGDDRARGGRRAARRRPDRHDHERRHAGPRHHALRGRCRGRDEHQGRERHRASSPTARSPSGARRHVATVGTQGANGTGLTLAAPLASAAANGTAVRYDGTGVTFTPALTAAHASGAAVLAPGTGITIASPLTGAQAAGATVRGHAGRADRRPRRLQRRRHGRQPCRELHALRSRQGGQRRQPDAGRRALPGDHADDAGDARAERRRASTSATRTPSAADYAGHFLSSDEKLNKIWYQGAYTNDTNSVPIGAVPDQTIPVILDGAKRDRRPWSGDLDLQGRTAFTSIGFGAKGSDYIKGSLQQFGSTPGRERLDLRPHPGLDEDSAARRLLLDELLDVPRAQRRRLLPVLGRHRLRAVAVRDHQAPARLQPLAGRSRPAAS